MRLAIITFLFLTISSFAFGQVLPDSTINNRISVLLNRWENKSITIDEKKEIANLTYRIQNKGFLLEENSRDYRGALETTNTALAIWVALSDTIGEANIRKYKGYLLGRLGDFTEAKQEIFTAIKLFDMKRMYTGVAVSQFDMSRVFDYQQKIDSALIYANTAAKFWETRKDTSRIVIVNNQLLHLFIEKEEVDSAIAIQKETKPLLDKKDLHWRPKIDFYFLSAEIYQILHNKELSSMYRNLYEEKLAELKKQNILTKSIYDN